MRNTNHVLRPAAKKRESTTVLLLIGLFKLVKALLLIAVGVGAFNLLHRDIGATVFHWVNVLRVDPDNRLIHAALSRILRVSPNELKTLGVGTFVYAALLLTEGTGLLLRRGWAEYFTLITTALLIPLEIYEIVQHLTVVKIIVMLVNAAIVVYLAWRVRNYRLANKEAAGQRETLPTFSDLRDSGERTGSDLHGRAAETDRR